MFIGSFSQNDKLCQNKMKIGTFLNLGKFLYFSYTLAGI
jgi:hypothetical protein